MTNFIYEGDRIESERTITSKQEQAYYTINGNPKIALAEEKNFSDTEDEET